LKEAINWLKSTFLYTRLFHNPAYYGISLIPKNRQEPIDSYLSDLCKQNLADLMSVRLIEECDLEEPTAVLRSTSYGLLMTKYCLMFGTMKSLILNLTNFENMESGELQPTKSLFELIMLLSESKEFEDIKLRTNEKSILNALNNNGKASKTKKSDAVSDSKTIRFVMDGKIKTPAMKICV
jgi:replicative superfamily II helicase